MYRASSESEGRLAEAPLAVLLASAPSAAPQGHQRGFHQLPLPAGLLGASSEEEAAASRDM